MSVSRKVQMGAGGSGGTPWTFDTATFNGGSGTNGQYFEGAYGTYASRGVVFNDDGSQMVVLNIDIGTNYSYLDSYTLETPYLVSSGTRTQRVQVFTGPKQGPLRVNDDGTKFFFTSSGFVLQFANLTTGWDLSTYTTTDNSDNLLNTTTLGTGGYPGLFNDTGTVYYAFPTSGLTIKVFNLSSPWDTTTGNVTAGTDITTISGQGFSTVGEVGFSHDGSVLYIRDGSSGNIFTAVDLTTPFDLTTINWSSKTLNPNHGTNITFEGSKTMGSSYFGVASTDSWTRIISCLSGLSSSISNSGPSAADVVNFDIEVPSNMYNPPLSDASTSVSGFPWYGTQWFNIGAQFNADGSKLIIGRHFDGGATEYFNVYTETLSTPYDLSTSSYNTTGYSSLVGFTLSSGFSSRSFRFTEDGEKSFFFTGPTNNYVVSYGTPFDASTRNGSTQVDLSTLRFSPFYYAGSAMFNDTKDEITFAVCSTSMTTTNTRAYNMAPGLYTVPLGTAGDINTIDISGLGCSSAEISSYSNQEYDNCGLEFNNTGSTYTTIRTAGNLGLTFNAEANYGVSTTSYDVGNGAGQMFPDYSTCLLAYSGNGVKGFSFNNDGTKAYALDNATSSIRSFDITTPYNIADVKNNVTAAGSYSAMPKNMWRRNDAGSGIVDSFTMNPTGTKIYQIRSSTGLVSEYPLSTAWDLSSSATSNTATLTTLNSTGGDIAWGNNGSYLFRLTRSATAAVLQRYAASTAYDLGSCGSTPDKTFTFGTMTVGSSTALDKMFLKPDGSAVFIYGLSFTSNGEYIFQFNMSTAWDPTTIASTTTPDVSKTLSLVNDDYASGIWFKSDGSKLIVTQQIRWYQFDLTTNWDISTIPSSATQTYDTFTLPIGQTCTNGLYISPDETKIFTGSSNSYVIKTDLGSALDFLTISHDGGTNAWFFTDPVNVGGTPKYIGKYNYEFRWKPDGTALYIWSYGSSGTTWPQTFYGSTGSVISQFNLSTAWDLSTATYAGYMNLASGISGTGTYTFDISSNGEHVIVGYDGLWMGTMTTPWDITSLGTMTNQLVDGFTWKQKGFMNANPCAVRWHPNNGSAIYTRGEFGTGGSMYTHKMTLTTSYDPTTAKGAVEGTVKHKEILPTASIFGSWPGTSAYPNYTVLQFQDNGNYVYFLENAAQDTYVIPVDRNIRAFSLSTPYDVTTATEMTNFHITVTSSPPGTNDFLNGQGAKGIGYFDWHPDGKKFIYTNGFLIGEYKV